MLAMKRSLISFVVTLAVLAWTFPVSAQKPTPVFGQTSTFSGFEVSAGYEEGTELYGWVCYGRTTGALNGNFTLAMDYEGGKLGTVGLNTISRGTWTLPVYAKTIRGETYIGVLYGTVTGGEIQWDYMGTGHLNLKLNITGGTQSLDGMTGQGEFAATIYRDGVSKVLMQGELTFYF